MLKKGDMVESEQQGVILGQQKMIGEVVGKLDGGSSHCTETSSIKLSREPSLFPLHLVWPVEMGRKALSQG